MVVQGSYYTSEKIVNKVFELLKKNICNYSDYVLIDTSCGYGSFLHEKDFKSIIGNDIDEGVATKCPSDVMITFFNALHNVDDIRSKWCVQDEKIIIVGNPPYNDVTSQTRKNNKVSEQLPIDDDIASRDLGISFLKSYDKLKVDYVCVLHPLSYLVKQTNFKQLKQFAKNYKMIDNLVISSSEFAFTSKVSVFPIVIGIYERNENGMTWDDVNETVFNIDGGGTLKLSNYKSIGEFIDKYPNQQRVSLDESVAIFYTMRDINALKRSKTFMDKVITNSVLVTADKLHFYCYVDVFKEYCSKLPFYFGNLDVFIDIDEFNKISDYFVAVSSLKHPELKEFVKVNDIELAKDKVDKYFSKLFT